MRSLKRTTAARNETISVTKDTQDCYWLAIGYLICYVSMDVYDQMKGMGKCHPAQKQ